VAPLTKDMVRNLAGFRASGPVTSLYLDVDGRRYVRPQDYEYELEHLEKSLPEDHRRAAAPDLARIWAWVRGGIDRSRTRGLVAFASETAGLWETLELPVAVRSQLVVNESPYIKQLEGILDTNQRFGVLLVDKQRARVFVFELGELVDRSELFDQLPRHEDDKGDYDRDHVHDHQAAAAQRHLRRAAQVAFAVHQEQQLDHVIIGAPEEITRGVETELHPYLRERVAARLSVPVNARDGAVRQAALEVEARVQREREAAIVGRLREGVASGNGAVAGLDPVLSALFERRVGTLIVSDGFEAPGWRCGTCLLAAKGPRCATCGGQMEKVDDVVEEAVEEAISQSSQVEICVGNADLDVLGRIGALLRF
jgi:peptide subunit release factor 1 (eRF1)